MSKFPEKLSVKLTKQIAVESIMFEVTNTKPTGCKSVGHCVLAHAAALTLGKERGLVSGFQSGISHDETGFTVYSHRDTILAKYEPFADDDINAQSDLTNDFDGGDYKAVMDAVGQTFRYERVR